MQGPMKLMHDGYMRSGEVFTVPVLHKNFTFLLGPHVSGHFFKANDDEMSQKEVSLLSLMSEGKAAMPAKFTATMPECTALYGHNGRYEALSRQNEELVWHAGL